MFFSSKRISRIASLLILLSLLLNVSVSAASIPETEPNASLYINSYGGALLQKGSTGLNASFYVNAAKSMDEIGAKRIVIQKQTGTNSWENVKTYTATTNPSIICTNQRIHSDTVSYTSAIRGYTYRAVITIYVSLGATAETRVLTTSSVTIS